MKINGLTLQICAAGILLLSATAMAQDADKQKLIEIEKQFAATATPGPEAVAAGKQYFHDGNLVQLTGTGRVGALSKAKVLELITRPDPSDPDVKSTQTMTDFRVELYGDTALVSYKLANTDTGHKNAALNVTDHFTCLDTFMKEKGQWVIIGDACARTSPYPSAEWAALKKAEASEPKDVHDAYH